MSPTGYRVWECKIVVRDDVELPEGFDFPPRRAAIDAVTDRGVSIVSCFSGWGGALTVSEYKALPRDKFDYPATSERLAMRVDAGNLTSAIASFSVRLASLEAKLQETNHGAPPGARVSDRQCASPADTGANKAGGTRTERVVLEVTGAPGWRVHVNGIDVESVRVVEDRTGTDMGNNVFVASTAEVLAMHEETVASLTAERDAAIRERDNERLVRIGTETDRDFARREKDAAIRHITELRTERDKLQTRVAELEAESEQLTHERDIYISNELSALRSWQKALDERDEARRERDALLESEAWGVACKPSPAASRGGSLARAMTGIILGDNFDADEKHAALATLVEAVCPGWVMAQARNVTAGEDSCAAQAASGGGESIGRELAERLRRFADRLESGELDMPSGLPTAASASAGDSVQGSRIGSGEPVAWGFATPDGKLIHASVFEPERDTATVVPLYRTPPQPRCFLTAEERDAVSGIALVLDRLKLYPEQVGRTKQDDLNLLWRIAEWKAPEGEA
jgi:hypothetical protein